MGSEWNKNNDSTTTSSYQPASQPSLCTKGCGFYGAAATGGFCSQCHRDIHMEEENKANLVKPFTGMSPSLSMFGSLTGPALPALPVPAGNKNVFAFARERSEPCRPNRCGSCNKKVGLASGFKCRCGITYCGTHRYPEAHECSFDFKASGRDQIAHANPVIKADKQSDRI